MLDLKNRKESPTKPYHIVTCFKYDPVMLKVKDEKCTHYHSNIN